MDESFRFVRRRVSCYFSPTAKKKVQLSNACDPNRKGATSSKTSNDMGGSGNLVKAIKSNNMGKVKEILIKDNNSIVNQVDSDSGLTPLHLSVGLSENETQLVKLLLDNGGDPNNIDIDEKLSPLHLSAMYDLDRVMELLIKYDGDLEMACGNGFNCYDIVKQSVEDEMKENCFKYLFSSSKKFRISLGPCPGGTELHLAGTSPNIVSIHDAESEEPYTSERSLENFGGNKLAPSPNSDLHGIARRLFPDTYDYLMTGNESLSSSFKHTAPEQINTIQDESGVAVSDLDTPSLSYTPHCRGIASMTAPYGLLNFSTMSDLSPSCLNFTQSSISQPTNADLMKLQANLKKLNPSSTASTSGIFSHFSRSESSLLTSQTSTTEILNYSSELQTGLQNIALINEWGNLKVDFVQNSTPTGNTLKSYYNYFLLDSRLLKRVNFSGNHLKTKMVKNEVKFLKFLEAVFYIGKAKGKHSPQPFVDAKKYYLEKRRKSMETGNKNIDKILEIWRSGLRVTFVKVHLHISDSEAIVNESIMIGAMGSALSHLNCANLRGTAVGEWPPKMKNQFGSSLLYAGFKRFLVDEDKGIRPDDVV